MWMRKKGTVSAFSVHQVAPPKLLLQRNVPVAFVSPGVLREDNVSRLLQITVTIVAFGFLFGFLFWPLVGPVMKALLG